MDRELEIIREKTDKKIQDFFNSPVTILNENVPYEQQINFNMYGKYTIKEMLMLLCAEEMYDNIEERTKAIQLINLSKLLNSTPVLKYTKEERSETQQRINSVKKQLSDMGLLIDLSLFGIILRHIKSYENDKDTMKK